MISCSIPLFFPRRSEQTATNGANSSSSKNARAESIHDNGGIDHFFLICLLLTSIFIFFSFSTSRKTITWNFFEGKISEIDNQDLIDKYVIAF